MAPPRPHHYIPKTLLPSSTSRSTSHFPFLSLPPELRIKIYTYIASSLLLRTTTTTTTTITSHPCPHCHMSPHRCRRPTHCTNVYLGGGPTTPNPINAPPTRLWHVSHVVRGEYLPVHNAGFVLEVPFRYDLWDEKFKEWIEIVGDVVVPYTRRFSLKVAFDEGYVEVFLDGETCHLTFPPGLRDDEARKEAIRRSVWEHLDRREGDGSLYFTAEGFARLWLYERPGVG